MTRDTNENERAEGEATRETEGEERGTRADEPARNANVDGPERVFVPLEILEGETVDRDVTELLSTVAVVVFGYHEVPEQTAPGQMRQQFEDRATSALEAVADEFREAGSATSIRLAFVRDVEGNVDRVADEVDATALLHPNPTGPVRSLLVPIRGDVDSARLAAFLATLRGDRDVDITLFAAASERKLEAAELALEGTREALLARGVPAAAVETRTRATATPVAAIVDAAVEHDAVVIGERERDWRSLIFGELEERIATESVGPVIVVRRRSSPGE